MDEQKAYEENLAAHLAQWSAQLSVYKAKADAATADAKIEYCKLHDSLRQKHAEGTVKLQDLKASSGEAWKTLKAGSENAWTEMKTAFAGAASKFK